MADYSSTARSLALPISPPRSPSNNAPQPHWTRHSHSFSRNSNTYRRPKQDLLTRSFASLEKQWRWLYHTAERMTPVQQFLTFLLGFGALILTILFFVFSARIFAWLEPFAEKWKNLRGGWLILWALCFTTAFPPVIGYSTCLTLAGFIYGFPAGWPIVATATVAGSTCSFLVSRTLLKNFVDRLISGDTRFEALNSVLKHDGLKLLIMIRLCPLPYSLSNGAISTFPTVRPLMFALATAAATPRLLIAVFVGSRLAAIAKSGEKMDARTKAINWISIIFGVLLGVVTGWLIYTRTMSRSQQLESEGFDEAVSTPDPTSGFLDDPEQAATATLIRDDQIDFLDQGLGDDYHDEFTDEDEDNVFRYGDGDDGESIGLNRQSKSQIALGARS